MLYVFIQISRKFDILSPKNNIVSNGETQLPQLLID